MKAIYAAVISALVANYATLCVANAELRIEDRIAIGNIAIKYDSDRWRLLSHTPNSLKFMCRDDKCQADVLVVVESKEAACTKEKIKDLALERLKGLPQKFSNEPEFVASRRYAKMNVLFACGEYRGQTYSAWIMPLSCRAGNSEALLSSILSGMTTR